MSQDSNKIWQEMMANWQTSQNAVNEQMLISFKHWNEAVFGNKDPSINPVPSIYQKIFDAFSKNTSPLDKSGSTNYWEQYVSSASDSETMIANIKKLMQDGEQLFTKISHDFTSSTEDSGTSEYLLNTLADMSNPNNWLKYSGDTFDIGADKLSEGPSFSGGGDIDQRMEKVSDGWRELSERSRKYHTIVFSRWAEAYSSFMDNLKTLAAEEEAAITPRQLVDMWSHTANEKLLELHRSEEFLNAQRAVIRASMQYRLNEKAVAESICEILHIPTRGEIDELHKTVTELRRELRENKKELKRTSLLLDRVQKIAINLSKSRGYIPNQSSSSTVTEKTPSTSSSEKSL
ncbi:MAG: class III poly(R)-hydroxyalkanoic acid synthase PhaE subunit [Cellvibrionaceae bacterium]|jgi:class III poly(R)-hydroxyalkanoic acid synthase PhaE subunit